MTPSPPHPKLYVMRVVWGALCATALFYPLILVAAGHAEPAARAPDSVLVIALTAVSLIVAALSVFFPRMLFPQMAQGRGRSLLSVEQRFSDDGQHGFREVASVATTRSFDDPVAAENAAFAVYYTRLILELALAEAVSNFGLVLGFLGLGLRSTLPFFALALALQLARFPTRDRVLSAFEEALGARFPGPRTE